MSSPLFGPTPEQQVRRANWLGRYLDVEKKFDKKLKVALKDAASHIDSMFSEFKDDDNLSRQIRRQQVALAHKEVRKELRSLFGNVGNIIKDSRQDAAVAATDAMLFDERGVLATLFKNPADRQNYADSLRQTARRNIESVVTRVLETEMPLSQQVWKTQALSQGLVSRAVNQGIAVGASYTEIAESVKHLIRPDVPGGISYAATRLGRTETNNAFHAQSINEAQEIPWVHEMRWNLSKTHEEQGCLCEEYAMIGTFPKEKVPRKPHPHCRCYMTMVQEPYDQFEQRLVMGHYNEYLDEKMGRGYADRSISSATIAPRDLDARPPLPQEVSEILEKKKEDDGTWQTATTHSELVQRFQTEWADKGPVLTNFTPENIAVEDAKELLASVTDNLTKYPQAQGNFTQVVLAEGPDFEYARIIRDADGNHSVKFNVGYTRDRDAFLRSVQQNVKDGFHPKNTDTQAFYDMMTHEFGHILDNIADQRPRDQAQLVVREFYENNVAEYPRLPSLLEINPNDTPEGFAEWQRATARVKEERKVWNKEAKEWLKTEAPSGYSISDFGSLDSGEALAEAFLDVSRNGDDAKPLSKALHDKLIEELEAEKPIRDVITEWSSASESDIRRGDYAPNPVDIKDFIDLPDDDGRFSYREIYDERNTERNRDWAVEPTTYPAKETYVDKFGRRHNIFYDPDETSLETNDFGISAVTKEKKISEQEYPEGLIWRGMSSEEYEQARRRGYFQSLGESNVGGESQAGKTYFSTDIEQAGNYGTWFAQPEYKPTFDHPGYVIGIPDRAELIREMGTEVGVPGRIPFEQVEKVYTARPYAISPGSVGAVEDLNGWTPGSSTQPSILVKWSEINPELHKRQYSKKKSDDTVSDILDLLGISGDDKPVVKEVIQEVAAEPIPGVPEGWERYVKNALAQEDRTNDATVWMPVEELKKYREYDRKSDPGSAEQLEALKYVIEKQGVRSPLGLSTDGTTALLHEGNHRLALAEELGIKELPVRITLDPEVIRNEGALPRTLDDNLKTFVTERLSEHDYSKGPEVYWTGPEIERPDYGRISQDIDRLWGGSATFDEVKEDIRSGVQIAQFEGYDGIPDWLQDEFDMTFEYGDWSFLETDSAADFKEQVLIEYGKELVARAVHNKDSLTTTPLYRGIRVSAGEIEKLSQRGQLVSLPLSSFSDDVLLANRFAKGGAWQSIDVSGKDKGLLFRLEPGARVVNFGYQNEKGAFGKFRIIDVFDDDEGLKNVVLQQISMIEEFDDRSYRKKVKDIIPDITILNPVGAEEATEIFEGGESFRKAMSYFKSKDVEPVGFSSEIDIMPIESLVEDLEEISKRYPEATVGRIGFSSDFTDDEYAATRVSGWDSKGGPINEILFNEKWGKDPEGYARATAADVAAKWHYKGAEENPWRSTLWHEYGHAIDNFAKVYNEEVSLPDMDEALYDYWFDNVLAKQKRKPAEANYEKNFNAWIDRSLSKYSLLKDRGGHVDRAESLAEAFEVVERQGDKAPPAAKVLHRLLIESYKRAVGARNVYD